MKRVFILLIVLLLQGQSIYPQNDGGYKFVRVPESFSFLKEPNQYQLNALAAFLFEKYGYETLYKKPASNATSACDILQADVENDSGLFMTKLRVVLRNCADQIVFTSQEGKSREKDYKTAYHAALRDAFQSLDGVKLRNPRAGDENFPAGVDSQAERSGKVETRSESYQESNVPKNEKTYTNGSTAYRLEKTSSGFKLYREGEEEQFAALLKSGTGDHFIYTSDQIQGTALFDKDQNLIVEYLDRNSGQLLNLKYSIRH